MTLLDELEELGKSHDLLPLLSVLFLSCSIECFKSFCSPFLYGKQASSPSKYVRRQARQELFESLFHTEAGSPRRKSRQVTQRGYLEFALGLTRHSDRWTAFSPDEILSTILLVEQRLSGAVRWEDVDAFAALLDEALAADPAHPSEALGCLFLDLLSRLYDRLQLAQLSAGVREEVRALLKEVRGRDEGVQPLTMLLQALQQAEEEDRGGDGYRYDDSPSPSSTPSPSEEANALCLDLVRQLLALAPIPLPLSMPSAVRASSSPSPNSRHRGRVKGLRVQDLSASASAPSSSSHRIGSHGHGHGHGDSASPLRASSASASASSLAEQLRSFEARAHALSTQLEATGGTLTSDEQSIWKEMRALGQDLLLCSSTPEVVDDGHSTTNSTMSMSMSSTPVSTPRGLGLGPRSKGSSSFGLRPSPSALTYGSLMASASSTGTGTGTGTLTVEQLKARFRARHRAIQQVYPVSIAPKRADLAVIRTPHARQRSGNVNHYDPQHMRWASQASSSEERHRGQRERLSDAHSFAQLKYAREIANMLS